MRLGFREDTRGVSALVGAVLLLGILVIALASYQAVIVPQQNAQTEFDHNQQVEDEMVDFRNALLEARLDERERATSVKLGTRYQSRTLAVNPPPATGTLQSTKDTISVSGGGFTDFELNGNQFFAYDPSYSEYRDAGTIRYENTLVYHDFETANVPLSQQRLVRGDVLTLVPSEPDIDENGIDRVTYEPEPSTFRVLRPDDPTVQLPTALSQDDWDELLEGETEWDATVSEDEPLNELELTYVGDGEPLIRYTPVSDQQDELPEDERDDDPGDDDAETEINPAGEGDVIIDSVSTSGKSVTVTWLNNGDNPRTIEEVRVPFENQSITSTAV